MLPYRTKQRDFYKSRAITFRVKKGDLLRKFARILSCELVRPLNLDLKLIIIEYVYDIYSAFTQIAAQIHETIDPYFNTGNRFWNFKINTIFTRNAAVFFGVKFLLFIAFLILIRGGTPRYRYDYLTKLGWLKFISLMLASFVITLLSFLIC